MITQKCELCHNSVDQKCGSGRFCSLKCARSFSTSRCRKEINLKVSAKLKGRRVSSTGGFKPGHDPRRYRWSELERAKLSLERKRIAEISYQSKSWEELGKRQKKRRLREEAKNRCEGCGLQKWLGQDLMLEVHHIDGNNNNWNRNNVRLLCPNCHSQTDNFRIRKLAKTKRISDADILKVVGTVDNLGQLLMAVGLVGKGGNYKSMRRRLEKLGITKFQQIAIGRGQGPEL